MNGWMASPTQWTWVGASSRRWWRTGTSDVLQSMGSQRVGHDWVTEQEDYKTLRIRHLVNLYDLGFGSEFLDIIDATQNRNNKRKKLEIELHQNVYICTSKDTIKKVKRHPTEWGESFANHTTAKFLVIQNI